MDRGERCAVIGAGFEWRQGEQEVGLPGKQGSADSFGSIFNVCGEGAVGQIEKLDIGDTEYFEASHRFVVASFGVRFPIGDLLLTAGTVGKELHKDFSVVGDELGDQTAATKYVVVEMGGDNQRRTGADSGCHAGRCEVVVVHPEDPFWPDSTTVLLPSRW